MRIRERILGRTGAYRLLKSLVAPPRKIRGTVERHLMPYSANSVLDLGCGYGDLADYFPDTVKYVGVDSNPRYIEEAMRRHSRSNVTFFLGDVSDLRSVRDEQFDLVVMTGVLHHLDTATAREAVAGCHGLISSTGRFVCIEPVFHHDQGLLPRLIIASDRGRFVRDTEGYSSLVSGLFEIVDISISETELRIPYTHLIMSCRKRFGEQ